MFLEVVRFVHRHDFKRQIRFAHQPTQAFIVRHHPSAAIQRGDAVIADHAHHGIWIDGMDLTLPIDAQRGRAEDQHPALACRQARRHHGLAALAETHVIAQARAALACQVTHAGVLVVAQACALPDLDKPRLVHFDSCALLQMGREESCAFSTLPAAITWFRCSARHLDRRLAGWRSDQFFQHHRAFVDEHELGRDPGQIAQRIRHTLDPAGHLPGRRWLVKTPSQGAHGTNRRHVVAEANSVMAARRITVQQWKHLHIEQLGEIVGLRRRHGRLEQRERPVHIHVLPVVDLGQPKQAWLGLCRLDQPHATPRRPPSAGVGQQTPHARCSVIELKSQTPPIRDRLNQQLGRTQQDGCRKASHAHHPLKRSGIASTASMRWVMSAFT